MRKIATNNLPYNSLPLWEAARQREYRALPYPAKRLVVYHGFAPADALRLAGLIGWKVDE